MEMDDRKIKILHAIINDYINSGEPIGSRTIARKYDLGISSATIRNEMADLEDMGYLQQPHSSSGRIPSNKGYRLYVDRLMQLKNLSAEEEGIISSCLINQAMLELDKIIKDASTVLSEMTKLICVVKTPSVSSSKLKTIQLITVDDNKLLCVIVTDSGVVKNCFIKLEKQADSFTIEKMNVLLNHRLKGLTLNQIGLAVINTLKEDLAGYEDIFNGVIPILYDTLKEVKEDSFILQGEKNVLLHPEYYDMDNTRKLLSVLENKEVLNQISSSNKDMEIRIGSESYLPNVEGHAVISKTYGSKDNPLGTINIIGPTRMDYSKVIAILNVVTKELNKQLNEYIDDYLK